MLRWLVQGNGFWVARYLGNAYLGKPENSFSRVFASRLRKTSKIYGFKKGGFANFILHWQTSFLVSLCRYRGEFEKRMQKLLKELAGLRDEVRAIRA